MTMLTTDVEDADVMILIVWMRRMMRAMIMMWRWW